MKLTMNIKRLFLAGVIALSLLLGTLGLADKLQAGDAVQQASTVTTSGACWRCTG
jgi:hypothetical protein